MRTERHERSHTDLRGTGLPTQHSLLLQHRNATVHNNESGASVGADASTNVLRHSTRFP
jgi:hypothetical protein